MGQEKNMFPQDSYLNVGQEHQHSDEQWAHEISEWERLATAGVPTSAKGPAPVKLEVPELDMTPSPVPLPYKKTQLAAAKRLEKELKQQKSSATKPEARVPKKAKAKVKPNKSKKSPPAPANKVEVTKSSKGPLMDEMNKFVSDAKANGHSHREAMALWRESEERAQIVNSMSESERKRRRY